MNLIENRQKYKQKKKIDFYINHKRKYLPFATKALPPSENGSQDFRPYLIYYGPTPRVSKRGSAHAS